ncbi:hypothetical protein [Mesorhizobium sp. 131-2-1]|uniref:hypothetical protein n=1 Tax=Mesorhizobium sp. 131-2-1 TaxID=2744518 RepID=UPI001926D059|nr:hypothetical protein [Mesorhizobium sp. 131-2-1]BCG94359.1 hypothetical protein MesoLj131a_32230 [Mesorhizobium sp. 131-2-1]
MTTITRRAALGAIASVPATAGATAAFASSSLSQPDPHERFQAAVDELKAAAEALDPNIYRWIFNTNGDKQCGLLIAAFRTTTKYEGDGWYATIDGEDHDRIFVERAPERDLNGERWFRLTSYIDGRKCRGFTPESSFTVHYGPRIFEAQS